MGMLQTRDLAMAVNGIIGIKLGMTQIFTDDGAAVGCTVLQACLLYTSRCV